MRTVAPLFKEGALERIMNPTPKEPRRDRTSIQPGALVPAGSTGMGGYDSSVSTQMQHQGISIDHISNSVSNLHDTMSELKQSFTTLRIELNGPGRFYSELGNQAGDFNMVATVLRELKSKSDEMEKLKLEMEALKFKNRYLEEQSTKQSGPMLGLEEAIPEIHSPGLLHGNRKRSWPDSFPSGRTQPIADSFDDEGDIYDDFSLADAPVQPMKIPLKDPEEVYPTTHSPGLRVQADSHQHQRRTPRLDNRTDSARDNTNTKSPQQAIVKRPRVSQSVERPQSSGGPEKRKVGRPRKSVSQTTKPDLSHTPKPTPLTEQTVNTSGGSQRDHSSWNPSPNEQQHQQHSPPGTTGTRPSRSRSLRSRSRPPSFPPANSRKSRHSDMSVNGNEFGNHQDQGPAPPTDTNGPEPMKSDIGAVSTEPSTMDGKENPLLNKDANGLNDNAEADELDEKRKTRNNMARLAMQREEAMETEESR